MGIERLFEKPTIGELTPVGPGILWLRLPLPFQLDHINVWLIEEATQYTLIDCGANLPEVTEIWEELERSLFSKKPLGRIIVTHAHPDHVGMAGPLARKHECSVLMSAAEYFFTRAMSAGLIGFDANTLANFNAEHGLIAEKASEMNKARGNLFSRLVPEPPLCYLRIQDGDVLEISGRQWKCHAGYGHSPEHISLICSELNLMISGDMLLPTISTNVSVYGNEPEGNPLQAFLKSIERMQALPDDLTVLPSHGVPFKGLKDRCESLLRHHEHRLTELLNAVKQNGAMSAQDAVSVLFKRKMDGHQMSFAMGEAIAHLHYLWRLEKLEKFRQNGIWHFKTI